MRFLMMVKANKDSEAGVMPDDTLIAEMGRYNEELAKAGVLLDLSGLQPSSKSCRISISPSWTSPWGAGARLAHSIASSLDFTWMSQ